MYKINVYPSTKGGEDCLIDSHHRIYFLSSKALSLRHRLLAAVVPETWNLVAFTSLPSEVPLYSGVLLFSMFS